MRIVYVAPQKFISGAGLSMIGMIHHLKEHHEIIVIMQDDNNEYARRVIQEGVEVLVCDYGNWYVEKCDNFIRWRIRRIRVFFKALFNKHKARKMALVLKNRDIDLVHSNLRITDFGERLANYLGVPHILHIREYGEEDFNLHPIFYKKYTHHVMEKYSNKIIAISDGIEKKYKSVFQDKLIKISNGIDVEKFSKEREQIFSKETVTISMISSIARTKGQMDLVDAVSHMEHVEVNIAGECFDEKFRKELAAKIQNNKAESYIKFTGFCKDVEKVLWNTDILVVASKREAFGRVTVEGMAAGCLVIGADTAGTKELLGNGRYGLLYKQGDAQSLSDQIKFAINNREDMKDIAAAAKVQALKNYSSKMNAEKIEKLYNQVIREYQSDDKDNKK